jgi:hypothetical protein
LYGEKMKDLTLGEYNLRTDPSSGEKIAFEHVPTGRTFEFDKGRLNGVQWVNDVTDLPEPESGVRKLDGSARAYFFTRFISDDATLDPNGVPLVGIHGSAGGYIHTGGGTAFQASDAGFYADNFYGHAPGGTLFDLSADNSTRFYVTDTAFFDPDNLFGDIADLGTIDGYKVVSFKSVNFEHFNSGITVTGNPDKVFFQTCPLRNVGTGVTCIHGDADLDVQIFKVDGCYVKNVQSDTKVLDIDSNATVNEYVKYQNVDHDNTVTKSNILSGQARRNEPGAFVSNSLPIADSQVAGELVEDGTTPTVTGSGSGEVTITDGTYTLNLGERISNPSPGVIKYNAFFDGNIEIDATVSVSESNTTYTIAVKLNGSTLDRSKVESTISGANEPDTTDVTTIIPSVTAGDEFSVALENTGGTTDLTLEAFNLKAGGV